MPDEKSSYLDALRGIDPAEAMPFGAGATPQGSPTALSGMLSGILSMPKHLMENSQFSVDTGNYDPKEPVQAVAMMAGMGAPAAEVGAAGIFGGKLAKTADLAKLEQAQ